jgi:DNA primase
VALDFAGYGTCSTPRSWRRTRFAAVLDPGPFNVGTTPDRLAGPDPWRDFWSDRQALPQLAAQAPARGRTVA